MLTSIKVGRYQDPIREYVDSARCVPDRARTAGHRKILDGDFPSIVPKQFTWYDMRLARADRWLNSCSHVSEPRQC